MNANPPPIRPALADDIEQARALLSPLCGKGSEPSVVLLLLGAIWLAVERLRRAETTSAQPDNWRASKKATEAKARELGMWPADRGEDWPEFRARIAIELKRRGQNE